MKKEKTNSDIFMNVERRWMKFHIAVMALVTCIQLTAEIFVFFLLRESAATQISTFSYLLTYVLLPSGMNLVVVLINLFIVYKTKLPHKAKVYTVSLSFVMCVFIVTCVHSIFSTIYIVFLIPLLLTTLYGSQLLAAICAGTGSVLIWVSKFLFADANPDTAFEAFYDVNVTVCFSLFICAYIVCVFIIYFEQQKQRMTLQKQTETNQLKIELMLDDLTGVNNKLALRETLAKITQGASKSYYLQMIDIKNFSNVNDKYGHLTGDMLLENFGQLLRQNTAKENLYRFSGDEFCVVFETGDATEVIAAANKLCDDFSEFVKTQYSDLNLSLKIGIATNYGLLSGTEMLEDAYKALSQARKSATERICFYKK